MQHTRSRKLKTLVATLAVAAVAAPVTQAAVDAGSGRGTPIPWGATDARHQVLVDRYLQAALSDQGAKVDPHHQILLRHQAAGKLVYVSHPSAVASGGGTDWNDVGIGAAGAFVLVLLGTGTLLVTRKKLASA